MGGGGGKRFAILGFASGKRWLGWLLSGFAVTIFIGSIHLGSAPGGYQVIVAGHTPDGRIGSVRTVLPISPAAPK